MEIVSDPGEWRARLRREYGDVRFEDTAHPPGVNAVCDGVLVGRYFSDRDPPHGVIHAQPRSCGAKPW